MQWSADAWNRTKYPRVDHCGDVSRARGGMFPGSCYEAQDDRSAIGRLPPVVAQTYAAVRGVRRLYDWQEEVLRIPDVWAGRNLVFSLPTSGGKSLVAELLLLRALCDRRSAVLVMPYVALVDEKVAAFEPFTEHLRFDVEAFAGTSGRVPAPGGRPLLAVSTIERASGLVNTLLEEERLGELGCVVVDELHMVGEEGRGANLEILLTKLMECRRRGMTSAQIVGMSATIPNLHTIAKWLDAALYQTDFRPVALHQHVRVRDSAGHLLCDNAGREVRRLDPPSIPEDRDHLAQLTFEAIPEHSVLVFCATKVQCGISARWLCRNTVPECKRASLLQHRHREKVELIQELSAVSSTLDPVLADSILYGVAYHHAGLLTEERQLIEAAFRAKVLVCLCCTSTLAAGVNLPARRVVIKSPYTGNVFLTKSRYLQMCGRAGRAGLDELGESFLLLSEKDSQKAWELMRSEVEPIESQLCPGPTAEKAVLEFVATGLAATATEIHRLAAGTFCASAAADGGSVSAMFADALSNLSEAGMIGRPVDGDCTPPDSQGSDHTTGPLALTGFGSSAFRSGFTVSEARLVKEELRRMQEGGLVLADDLHMTYFLTHIREARTCRVDWRCYWQVLTSLQPIRRRIASLIGVQDGYVLQQSVTPTDAGVGTDVDSVARRFFVALILTDLLNEVNYAEVAGRYGVDRGSLQQLLNSTAMFSAMMTRFAETMGWGSLQVTIASFVKRLGCGVKMDLVELTDIKGVQSGRARLLWNAGLKTVKAVAAMESAEELHRRVTARRGRMAKESPTLKFFSPKVAAKILEAAKDVVRQRLKETRQEVVELRAISGPDVPAAEPSFAAPQALLRHSQQSRYG